MTLEQAYKMVLEDLSKRERCLRSDYEADFGRLKLFKDEKYRAIGLYKLDAADELRDARQRGFNI